MMVTKPNQEKLGSIILSRTATGSEENIVRYNLVRGVYDETYGNCTSTSDLWREFYFMVDY